MEGLVPRIIVSAIGAAVLGAPEALGLLLDFAGRNPVVDLTICFFVISMFTAQILGVVLLARFVRKPPAQFTGAAAGGAVPRPRSPAADCFAKMTLVVSMGVAVLVSACLVVVPGAGGQISSANLVIGIDFPEPSLVVAALTIVGTVLVARFSRDAAGTGAEGFGNLRQNASVLAVLCFVLSVIQYYAYAPPAHI